MGEAFVTRLDGPSPEREIARDMIKRALWVAPVAIVLFGWVYLTIGGNPRAFRPFLQIAIVAKAAFFLVVAFVCFFHRELLAMLAIAVGDLAFGALFYRDWRAVR